jgi:hypothetical protein
MRVIRSSTSYSVGRYAERYDVFGENAMHFMCRNHLIADIAQRALWLARDLLRGCFMKFTHFVFGISSIVLIPVGLGGCTGETSEPQVDEMDLSATCKPIHDSVNEARELVREHCGEATPSFDEALHGLTAFNLAENRSAMSGGRIYATAAEVTAATKTLTRVTSKCTTTPAGQAAARKVTAFVTKLIASNLLEKLTPAGFRCATPQAAIKILDASVFMSSEITSTDAKSQKLRAELVKNETALWYDTALEGPYALDGELSVAQLTSFSLRGTVYAYNASFTAPAVFTESEGCRFSERTQRYGTRCERGTLSRTASFFTNGAEIDNGAMAEFE